MNEYDTACEYYIIHIQYTVHYTVLNIDYRRTQRKKTVLQYIYTVYTVSILCSCSVVNK